MRIYSAEDIALAERRQIDAGISSDLSLMETAAEALSQAVEDVLGHVFSKRIAIFCGGGKNGGDGYAAACNLKDGGADVTCIVPEIGTKEHPLTKHYREKFSSLCAAGKDGRVYCAADKPYETEMLCQTADLIIDAMFGTGFYGSLTGGFLRCAELINGSAAFVIAADIPTGCEGTSALASDGCVQANMTVTFSHPKPAHYVQPAKSFCGTLKVADIGLRDEYVSASSDIRVITDDYVRTALPARKPDTHKGSYGKVLVVGGSVGYTGAPLFSASAAARCGSGLVYLAACEDIYAIQASRCMEVICLPFAGEYGKFSCEALEKLVPLMNGCSAVVIGPGLGLSGDIKSFVSGLLLSAKIPVILDADGINAIRENIDILKQVQAPVVLTPHDVEFGRLGGSLEKGRLEGARKFAAKYGVTVVLKGNSTVVASPDGKLMVNATGNPGMAKGGSGDILAGMIASLVGLGVLVDRAACCGVFLHGFSGDLAASEHGMYGMLPTDMLDMLPRAIKLHTEGETGLHL